MPTNLNALIRYKQIDRELRNPYLKTTIKSLQESCSKQLAEHRGVYKLISERTIRDDIRVMRSSALGFNAPIIVEGGIYSYNDSEYSVFKSKIERIDILKDVLNLLIEEKDQITVDGKEIRKQLGLPSASPITLFIDHDLVIRDVNQVYYMYNNLEILTQKINYLMAENWSTPFEMRKSKPTIVIRPD